MNFIEIGLWWPGKMYGIRDLRNVEHCRAFVGFYTIPFGYSLFLHFWGINFQLLELLCLAKDH